MRQGHVGGISQAHICPLVLNQQIEQRIMFGHHQRFATGKIDVLETINIGQQVRSNVLGLVKTANFRRITSRYANGLSINKPF